MTTDLARRFLQPTDPRQRRYEALRACCVEGCTTAEAARRFNYSPGSLRNLRSRFANSEDPGFLFPSPQQAKPQSASDAAEPSAEARRRALELRREGLSIHDIRERLAAEGLPLSVGTVQNVLSPQAAAPQARSDAGGSGRAGRRQKVS